MGSITKVSVVAVLALVAVACKSEAPRSPTIGEAFVGPASLKIRNDIPLQSPTVATVRHGERLEILQRRRRFMRVRTPTGTEGWTDERQLLGADDMKYLKELAQRAAKMPAQGQGTSFGDLNVHTQPARGSPSFVQIKEKEKVDVLVHVSVPRTEIPRKPLLPPPPKKQKAAPKKSSAKPPKYPPPPMPAPPPLPKDWLELSKTDLGEDADPPDEEVVEEKPTPTDDWSLVRTAGGQSGWVLTRRLIMAIPDEVAQYAEGRRIVSYFSLGKVADEGVNKDVWLWTTVTDGPHPWDFESFRVFIWSLRRHRYETAYIERNVHGYAPVLVKQVDYLGTQYPGFSVCVEKKDGQKARREFALLSNVLRYAGESPCEAMPPVIDSLQAPLPAPLPTTEQPPAESFKDRMKKRFRNLFHRTSG